MVVKRSQKNYGYWQALAIAQADEDPVTPPIPGVSAGGVIIELIKDGFNGTEGPIGYTDGSLLFTETHSQPYCQDCT